MRKRLICILICMLFCFSLVSAMNGTAVTAEAKEKPRLCRISNVSDTTYGLAYYTEGSDIQGYLETSTIVELLEVNQDKAKIRYKGGEFIIDAACMEKVDAPETVCSAWARDLIKNYDNSYIGVAGEWSGVEEDYSKLINRDKAYNLILNVMYDVYGEYSVDSFMTKGYRSTKVTGPYDGVASRLALWGVIPSGKLRPEDTITYQEVATMLVKLMEYDQKIIREGGGDTFTKADIAKFKIGGKTSAKSKCTIEQVMVLCNKTVLWWKEMELMTSLKYDKGTTTTGAQNVASGDMYTIQTCLGTEPKQPYVVINKDGQGELSSKKSQKYKVEYKGMQFGKFDVLMTLCTIKTKDGKYLAMSEVPLSGSRLFTQKKEYLWYIQRGQFVDDQQVWYIMNPYFSDQVVCVPEYKTEDGTPIVAGYWNGGTGNDNNNAAFIFERVKK